MELHSRGPRIPSRTARQLGEADFRAQRRAAARQAALAWKIRRGVGDRSPAGRRHLRTWEARR